VRSFRASKLTKPNEKGVCPRIVTKVVNVLFLGRTPFRTPFWVCDVCDLKFGVDLWSSTALARVVYNYWSGFERWESNIDPVSF
jgi:hypothetical protein